MLFEVYSSLLVPYGSAWCSQMAHITSTYVHMYRIHEVHNRPGGVCIYSNVQELCPGSLDMIAKPCIWLIVTVYPDKLWTIII